MAKTLSSIAGRQAKATEQVRKEVKHFLDYCTSHPDKRVRFVASDMILALHSDASYLTEPNSKSRAAGHFYLRKNNGKDLDNGAILNTVKNYQACNVFSFRSRSSSIVLQL